MMSAPTQLDHLREVDARRDLNAIANLIDICFWAHLDPEGRAYLNRLRRLAVQLQVVPLRSMANAAVPIQGFVWEEKDEVVGNLTLIAFRSRGQLLYLIANVAVHPDYRQKGIGRALTQHALDYIRATGAASAWLHVRADNPTARHLYDTLKFEERCQRVNWVWRPEDQVPVVKPPAGVTVGTRRKAEWGQQRAWLQRNYPAAVDWNLMFDAQRLKPGELQSLWRWLNSANQTHLTVRRDDEPLGLLTWETGAGQHNFFWLATPEEPDEAALTWLLMQARHDWTTRARFYNAALRPIQINYAAGQAAAAFEAAGFSAENHLVWMEHPLR